MDIRILLKKDHLEALKTAKTMSQTNDAEKARALFKELKMALTAHSRAEEKVVYGALKRTKVDKAVDMAHEGDVEHALCDDLLAQMTRGKADSATWQAKAKVLHELLEHHIEEEHEEMFAQLEKQFSDDELSAMGERFEAAKESLMTTA